MDVIATWRCGRTTTSRTKEIGLSKRLIRLFSQIGVEFVSARIASIPDKPVYTLMLGQTLIGIL